MTEGSECRVGVSSRIVSDLEKEMSVGQAASRREQDRKRGPPDESALSHPDARQHAEVLNTDDLQVAVQQVLGNLA